MPPVFTEPSYTAEPQSFKRLTRQHFKNNWNAPTGKQVKRPHGTERIRRRHMRNSKITRDDDGDGMGAKQSMGWGG